MSFYNLVDNEDSNDDLPWFNEYLEIVQEDITDQIHLVNCVKSTQKGFILTTEHYNAWIWRKSTTGSTLSETLGISTQSDSYPQLAIMIKPKTKNKFVTGFLDDLFCGYTWNQENTTFTLHPQKNLPFEVSPSDSDINQSASVPGKSQKQSSAQHKASATSSKVESSQRNGLSPSEAL